MTVNVGPDRYLGASTLLGSTQVLGQGNSNTAKDVEYELLFSTDDAATSIPNWVYITSSMRAFSTSRGRSSERSTVDAGTTTITLDNRDRTYDPANTSSIYSPNLRPMNRVWLRARFNGLTHDIFKGYVESYEQQYPELGMDAVTIVKAVDEFKVLALRNQPTSDPPRESYADVVQFDVPAAYWRMSDPSTSFAETPVIGPTLASGSGGMGSTGDGAIAGDNPDPYAALLLPPTDFMVSETLEGGQGPELGGLNAFTIEFWLKYSALPASNKVIIGGPGGTQQWQFALQTNGTLIFTAVDSGVGVHTVTTSTATTVDTWYHICGVVNVSTTAVYINGVSAGTGSFSGVVLDGSGSTFNIGTTFTDIILYFDEFAVYRYVLPAARILAHYQAGAQRGFARQSLAGGQYAGARVDAILDTISSQTPRNLLPSFRPLAGQWTGNGSNTVDVLREVETADAVDAMLFIACDGTITYLSSDYRSNAPYTTVQATFGDIGNVSELDFMDIQLDYSDSFIANEWNVTRDGGTTFTSSDTTSQTRYLKRPQSLTGLKLADDTYTQSIADLMLAKYKDPLTRVLSIQPNTMNTAVIDAVFPLDLGDRVTVNLTPPGGGTRFSQTLFIQSISIDMAPEQVYPVVKLGVSPV